MKISRKTTILTSVAVLGIAIVGTTLAYFSDKGEAVNIITMGKVDIELTEPAFSENTGITNRMEDIVPNQRIDKDPTITVTEDSKDAYIRAKIEYKGLTEDQIGDLEKNIGFQEGWKKEADGYYYYEPGFLTPGSGVVFFDTVLIPEKWGNEIAGKDFEINITAEAIQADNFTPGEEAGSYGWYYNDKTPVTVENYRSPDL